MQTDKNNQQNSSNDPAQSNRQPSQDERQNGPGEGDYRNVETSVNSADSFGDDYEAEQEEEFTEEQVRNDDEGRDGKR